jgi:KGK domain
MEGQKEGLDIDDVVSLKDTESLLGMPNPTFKIKEFCKFLTSKINQKTKWEEGVEAEVLAAGKGWRKGKVKLTMQFIPDEPESPLDEIRKTMGINE